MAKKSKFGIYFEYALLRTGCALVNVLPYRASCALACGVAWLAFNVFRLKRERTLARIRAAFPGKPEKECVRIAVGSLQTVFLNVVEMIRAPKFDREWMLNHVEDIEINAGKVRALADEGHGVVVMVPHMGNWYMAAWALARLGVPLFAVAATQRNPLINKWMNRQYGAGMDVVERGSASVMREILARLKKGQVFAILPDLRVPEEDVTVPFLNATANVSHGGALFAVASGAPVIVASLRRERGHHTFSHLATLRPDPKAPDRKEEARRIMREVMAMLDAEVRKTPEQWFWFNKRWLLQPIVKPHQPSNG